MPTVNDIRDSCMRLEEMRKGNANEETGPKSSATWGDWLDGGARAA